MSMEAKQSLTPSLNARFASWLEAAEAKVAAGTFSRSDLDELRDQVTLAKGKVLRQRLLYLHAQTPSIASPVLAASLHEPVQGGFSQMDPLVKDPGYPSVHAAIIDGWEVIQFPDHLAPFDDREIDMLGYEFILQKKEYFDAE